MAPEIAENMLRKSGSYARFNDNKGVTYTCKEGFSFSLGKNDDKNKTVQCQANGVISRPVCKGNQCIIHSSIFITMMFFFELWKVSLTGYTEENMVV